MAPEGKEIDPQGDENKELGDAVNNFKFRMVCFSVLMQHGKGIMDKSPDYVFEKSMGLHSGSDTLPSYQRLDSENKKKVLEYCKTWKLSVPKIVEDYIAEETKLWSQEVLKNWDW